MCQLIYDLLRTIAAYQENYLNYELLLIISNRSSQQQSQQLGN